MMKQRCLTYLLLLLVALQSVMAVADTHSFHQPANQRHQSQNPHNDHLHSSGNPVVTNALLAPSNTATQQNAPLNNTRTASLRLNTKQNCNTNYKPSSSLSCELNAQPSSNDNDELNTCQHCCHCHGTTFSVLASSLLLKLPLAEHQDDSRYLKRAVITPPSSLYRPPIA